MLSIDDVRAARQAVLPGGHHLVAGLHPLEDLDQAPRAAAGLDEDLLDLEGGLVGLAFGFGLALGRVLALALGLRRLGRGGHHEDPVAVEVRGEHRLRQGDDAVLRRQLHADVQELAGVDLPSGFSTAARR